MDLLMMFDVMMLCLGVYMTVAAFVMKKSGRIRAVILTEQEIAVCRDKNGFIAYMYWRSRGRRCADSGGGIRVYKRSVFSCEAVGHGKNGVCPGGISVVLVWDECGEGAFPQKVTDMSFRSSIFHMAVT